MSVIAQVENGQLVQSSSSSSLSSANSSSGNSLDKDAFLQLLVAQMKYQDPLEPTSNTEYIAQLATFSELEEMQNMRSSMDLQRASGLVGQYVFMKVTSNTGNTSYVEGQVDYVVFENGKAFLSINENLYSIDDLDTVADSSYLLASKLATSFYNALEKLPTVANVSEADLESIKNLMDVYESMTTYQKSFLSSDMISSYEKYVEKYNSLVPKEDENTDAEG
ncbi:MAG: flagellar hook assembly protein FlgD [Lachnospiraceae bacterium]